MAATRKPVALDAITDPETGLALLAQRPDDETPEQSRLRLFWQFQFMQWRGWLGGDVLAFARALNACSYLHQGPPRWLRKAALELSERGMSDGDKRAYRDLTAHLLRWEAVQSVRGKKKVRGDAVWKAAAKKIADAEIKHSTETMRASHRLIQRAGGVHVTLQSYKRAVEERDRGRRKKIG